MSKYKYNFQNVKKGQQFKDFTAFFQAITGQKPQTGAKNRAAIERELSKYISYCKASEIKPEISSKRAIIIKEIYDSPRKIDENRGRHGKYANYLKPLLLLSCGYSSYEGKCTVLLILWAYSHNIHLINLKMQKIGIEEIKWNLIPGPLKEI